MSMDCKTCKGTGHIEFERGAAVKNCPHCKGTGSAKFIALCDALIKPIIKERNEARAERDELRVQVEEMRALIDTPHTDEWFEAVRLEAAHQIKRWGADHDAGKDPADWFWLLGYLGGKALAAAIAGNTEKAKHHTISSGAALLNWFRALTGDSDEMRPGIDAALQATP